MSVRVIISGGGTGGHIFPAISIANEIQKRISHADILFVGAKGKMEMEKVPKAGYPIIGLTISGIKRNWRNMSNLLFPFKLLVSLWKSYLIIKQFKPTVVVGTGGYASGPLLFMASKLSIPALIQEQNSFPGITNKLLASSVQKICVAYDKMERFFPKEKLLMLGNPVRQDLIYCGNKKQEGIKAFTLDEKKAVILVVGGSLGARTINQSIASMANELDQKGIQLIWQTGMAFEKTASAICEKLPHAQTYPFINNMDMAYSVADIIISRAGASTISELCLVGKPAILIPSPNVAEDHQTKNALSLVQKKAAIMISDRDAQAQLGPQVLAILKDENKQHELAKNIQSLAITNSSEMIVDEVLKLIKP